MGAAATFCTMARLFQTLLLALLVPVLCVAVGNSGVFKPANYGNRARTSLVLNRPPDLQYEPPSPELRLATGQPKPFFVVAAPESSGNRYVVRLLEFGGCYGRSDHRQPFDLRGDWDRMSKAGLYSLAAQAAPCYVMHRSIPHAKHWTDLRRLADSIQANGLEPTFITIRRNSTIVAASQLHEKHVRSLGQAERNIEQAAELLRTHHKWARSVGLQVIELEFSRMGDADYMQRTLYGPARRPAPPTSTQTAFANPDVKYK